MALRLFLVHEDSSIDRIAVSRFERLVTRKDPNERWPEYAGQRLRYALLGVEQDAEAGDPARVVHANFGFLTLDSDGRQCSESAAKSMRDAVDLMAGATRRAAEPNVVGEQAFRQRRFKIEHTWEPSQEVMRRLHDAIEADKPPARRARSRQDASP